MNSRTLATEFRTAGWGDPAEMEAFVARAGSMSATDLNGLLGLLLKRGERGKDLEAHSRRAQVFEMLVRANTHKDLFGPMVKSLRSADQDLARRILRLLPEVNNVAQHNEIVELFKQGDARIRHIGAQAFAKVPGKTAYSRLVQLCAERAFPGRSEAMDALISVGGRHGLPALRNVLQTGSTTERSKALRLLRNQAEFRKDATSILPAVAVCLKDSADRVVLEAISTYGALAEEHDFLRRMETNLRSDNIILVRATFSAMSRFSSPRVLRLLLKHFRMGPKSVRIAVLDTVESIGTQEMLPVLVEGLTHKQLDVRTQAAQCLERLAEAEKVDPARAILWLLRSKDVNVKRMAAQIANKVKDRSGDLWPQLFQFLRDEDWWVRERLTDALLELAGPELLNYAVLYLRDRSEIIRRYGIELLVRLNEPRAIGALVRAATGDSDWWVRERAIEALGNLGDKRSVPYIVDLMNKDPEVRLVSLQALTELGDKSASPHVAQLLNDDKADILIAALECLEKIGDPSLARMVKRCMRSREPRVREVTQRVLRQWRIAARRDDAIVAEGLSPLDRLLRETVRLGGDDLIVSATQIPYIKKHGQVVPLGDKTFTEEELDSMVRPHLRDKQLEDLENLRDADYSYEIKSEALRFRVNVFRQQLGLSAVFRAVSDDIPELRKLGLPPVVHTFGDLPHGLILIGGPTGSGKSTTLAAIIDYINRKYSKNIITLEDPIEVIHSSKKSLINQREVGAHTISFASALRSCFREDPDVILVGEMRDQKTIYSALQASETGHLVLGTVHTASADTTVDRVINAFPSVDQPTIRSILANNLRAICCQHLLKHTDGEGRAVAVEVMLNSDAIAQLIRKGRTYQIPNVVATSRDLGMESMDNALFTLVRDGKISAEDGYMKAVNKKEFSARLSKEGIDNSFITAGPVETDDSAEVLES